MLNTYDMKAVANVLDARPDGSTYVVMLESCEDIERVIKVASKATKATVE